MKMILFTAFFQFISSQSLQQILTKSLQTHPLLRAAKHQEDGLRQSAKFNSSFMDAKIMATYFPQAIVTANGPQQAVFQISQTIPFFGSLGLKESIGNSQANALVADRDLLRNRLIFQISRSYYQLAANQEQLRLVTNYKQLLNSFYQSALVKYEQSLGSQQAVLKAQTEIVRMDDLILDLNLQANSTLSELNQFANTNYQQLEAIFPEIQSDTSKLDILQLPEMRSLQFKQDALETELQLIGKESLPEFQLGLQYSIINERQGITGNQDAIGIQFAMSLPFLSGKYAEKEAAVMAKKMALDEQVNYQESLVKQRVTELKARNRYLTKRLNLYETNLITKAELTLNSSLASYETGELDFLNVLDAERLLLEVRKQAIEIQLKLLIAQAEYKQQTTDYQSGVRHD